MITTVFIGVASGLAAVIRHFVSKINRYVFPIGTLIVNIAGAFLIGILYTHMQDKTLYTVIATGFCGGLTTFSTLNYEFITLIKNQKIFFAYLIITYLLGLIAVFAGMHI